MGGEGGLTGARSRGGDRTKECPPGGTGRGPSLSIGLGTRFPGDGIADMFNIDPCNPSWKVDSHPVVTETVAHQGECRHVGHATTLHSIKSHNTDEDPRFGGPILVIVGTFETKARPSRGVRVYTIGGGNTMGGWGGTDTRHETIRDGALLVLVVLSVFC